MFYLVHNLGMFLIIPFFSLLLSAHGWNNQGIGLFFTVFHLATFLFAPVIGKYADHIGRKRMVCWGIIGQILILLGYYLTLDWKAFSLVLRFLDGVMFGVVTAVSIGAFERLVPERRGMWTGVFMSLGVYGKLLGPLLGGLIAQYLFRDGVLLFGALLLLCSLGFLLFIPESKNTSTPISYRDFIPLTEVHHFLGSRKLAGVGVMGILTNALYTFFVIFFPLLIVDRLGFSESALGMLLALRGVSASFQFFFCLIADRFSAEFGIILGSSIMALAFMSFSFVTSYLGFAILLLICGTGMGIWNVCAWVLMGNQSYYADDEAEVVGTYMSLSKLGMVLVSMAGALLVDWFGIISTLTYLAWLLLGGTMLVAVLFSRAGEEPVLLR